MREDRGRTVLVTGGAGFIGSHLIEALLRRGDTVISLDNYFTGSKERHHTGATYIEGHTKDIASLVDVRPQLIYHLGEYSRVEQSFEDVATVLAYNGAGTHATLEFARACGAKLVYAGSSTRFADGGMGRDQSPYAWTKASNTELVRNYGQWFSLPYAITYFYNVYGPGEISSGKYATVIGLFAEKYKKGEPLPVRLPGTQRRNFTHVYDIVDGLVRVGERGEGDEFGLGHQESFSILEIAEMFGGAIEMLPERPGNRMAALVDTKRAEHELQWKPSYTVRDFIAGIVRSGS